MRKLAWFVIALLLGITILAVLCAMMPSVSATVYNIAVNYIGLNIVKIITGGITGMMAWGATGLGPAAAVFFGIGIGFTVLWLVVLRKYVWSPIKNAPRILKGTSTPTLAKEEPRDIIMTENPTATKKKEVAATE
jgi:hypothetical protein